VKFDTYTIVLLLLRPDAPAMPQAAEAALQDAHMEHLAALHERGELLAAGPVLGDPERELRGFAIFQSTDLSQVSALADEDPAVRAGRYRHEFHSWMLPSGLMSFAPGRLPRSMSEASG
jgi:uncharacterized protein